MVWLPITLLLFIPWVAEGCGYNYELTYYAHITFTSPNFPFPYPTNVACSWYYSSPQNTQIRVFCDYVNLYYSHACTADNLHFYLNGNLPIYNYVCGYFGETNKIDYTTTSNTITAEFVSPYSYTNTQFSGFRCAVSVIGENPKALTGTSQCSCGISSNSRIIGGEETKIHKFPWQAAIKRKSWANALFCGGALIAPQWVLTAAHCIVTTMSDFTVTLGEHNLASSSETKYTINRNVIKIIKHKDYNGSTYDNDIALLKLNSIVSYNVGVRPACLPFGYESALFTEIDLISTGWGMTSYPTGQGSSVLREVYSTVISNEECANKYSDLSWPVTDNMFCTNRVADTVCKGDSGGSIMWRSCSGRYFLLGLVSWSYECGIYGHPDVSTKVVNYLSWIKSNSGVSYCERFPSDSC